MLIRLLLIIILIVISLFCWLSLLNPLDVEFHFFGRIIPTDLSTLMISSFVLGAMLVFISTSYLPFTCLAYKRESKEWIAYCLQCHQWSTYAIEERDKAFTITAFPSSEQLPLPFRLNAQGIPL